MKLRVATATQPWTNGNLTIDFAGTDKRNKKFVVLHLTIAGHKIARIQLKGRQIYELVNAIVDATEAIEEGR